MEILNKEEIEQNKDHILREIRAGSIFIYPTDTIYGIGCNALNDESVTKIRELKQRSVQPFSVIAPSKEWIKNNCNVKKEHHEWLDKLPGPYTFIFRLKNKNSVSNYVIPGLDSLGIRIPKHWFTEIAQESGVPIVTTSVNKSGEEYMTSLDDLDLDIKKGIKYCFYDGEKKGRPSTLVILKDKPEVVER